MPEQTVEERFDRRITTNRQATEVDYTAIRANKDLNDEAQHRLLREAYDKAIGRHKEILAEIDAHEKKRREDLEAALYTPPSPGRSVSAGDKAQHHVSLRDAYERADRAADEDFAALSEKRSSNKLSKLLSRADAASDENLAYAAFLVAKERGNVRVVEEYLSRRPAAREKYEELQSMNARPENPGTLLGRAVRTAGPRKPVELTGSSI